MAINNTAPVRIGWFWDGGIEIRLGDDMNGYLAEETVRTVAEIVPWLQEAIAHFYPGSSYARSLTPELRERAKQGLFQPPKIGAQVICPDCGAPHATPPGMDERFAFVCHHCGNPVEVPKACYSVTASFSLTTDLNQQRSGRIAWPSLLSRCRYD